jgi:thioredoxin:protein disulfide reductase
MNMDTRWRIGLAGLAWIKALGLTLLLLCWGHPAVAEEFLEPEQAFRLSAQAKDDRTVDVRFDVAPGYYLYRERLSVKASDGTTLGDVLIPPGQVKFDENFQKNVETYHDGLSFTVPVTQAPAAFTLTVNSQGCADAGLCYPPQTQTLRVSLRGWGGDGSVVAAAGAESSTNPAATSSLLSAAPSATPTEAARSSSSGDSNAVESVLRQGSLLAAVGAFWLMGVLLSLTPCVLPMVPILSSIIAGGGEVSRGRGLLLAAAYSLGMALVYAGLGVAAGLAGEGLAAWMQQPWVLALFAALLVGFALSMFDVYELRLPVQWASRLEGASRALPGGRLLGVLVMGGVSALIVSPCVTAPLAGVLLFLSQTGDVPLAATALFSMAVGMSTPLLVLGASAGTLLPRSGAWMNGVKHFFGLLLIGVALWTLQPVLPMGVMLLLWGVLLLVVGFMLRPFDAHPHAGAPRVWLQRAAGLAALTLGVMQLAGAVSGGRDPLQPLSHWVRPAAAADVPAATGLRFESVRSVQELEQRLQSAGRPVMLDFYADWCVSCKEMERFTFSDPAVQRRLAGALLLKADVTANSEADRALLKRFQLFGPPGTIFFDAQGREVTQARVVGFLPARDFENSLKKAGL